METREKHKSHEISVITPIRKLEDRIERLESHGTVPQLQSLINQIVELIRTNQKIVNDVVKANMDLRSEVARLPPKLEDVSVELRKFISMIEAASMEEMGGLSAEALKPLSDNLARLVEQNQRMIENNQAILEALDNINKKLRAGTPVSSLTTAYPSLRFKKLSK